MVKRILILVLVSFVTITGYISLRKLNYWDRSVMIFKIDSSQQSLLRRGGRGSGGFESREGHARGPEFREDIRRPGERPISDSLGRRPEGRGQRNFSRLRGPDSTGVTGNIRDTVFSARGEFGDRRRGGERNGGRDFRRGSTVNLNLVIYYLAVFAFFTLLAVYIEKFYRLIFRKKT